MDNRDTVPASRRLWGLDGEPAGAQVYPGVRNRENCMCCGSRLITRSRGRRIEGRGALSMFLAGRDPDTIRRELIAAYGYWVK